MRKISEAFFLLFFPVISLYTISLIIYVKDMKTRVKCKRERQPVEDRIDTLRVVFVFDDKALMDYTLIFGKIREEVVREVMNESLSGEGVTVIKPISNVVVLDVYRQSESNVSGMPLFTELRDRWLYVDTYGWLMVWRKRFEMSVGYRVMTDCEVYELPEDALRVYRGLRIKARAVR